jgi:glycerol-1-phosphate dehydrogenase [NAD(P)+]
MKLTYDPGDGHSFWQAISQLPGYPQDEHEPISQMVFASGAISQIPEVLQKAGADHAAPLLVVMDQTPMKRGKDDLKRQILDVLRGASWEVETLVMEPDSTGQVHTDMPHIDKVKASLRPGVSVLSVGSGVVTDITKHACYLFQQETGHRVPFVVFQTANSVSAYTSNMAPVFVDGVKRTLPSTYADALICDLETLRDAPKEMTVAGVGDLLAAFVSLPDWVLAHRLGMDAGYNELPQQLMGRLDDIFLAEAEAIRTGSPEGMSILARLISLGGLAMSLTHATTSMSGYEHVMSHILDLLAETSNTPLAQHGTQVAMAAIIGAEVYRRFFAEFDPASINIDDCYPSADEMHSRIQTAFHAIDPTGKAGEECWSDYRLKLETWHAHRADLEAFLNDWPTIKPQLEKFTAPPERLAEILRAVESPVHFADLVPPAAEDQVRFAFMNAPLMRKRLTIGDVLIFFRWDREQLWKEIWEKTQSI